MRIAYVVWLGPGTEPARGHFEGSVEQADICKRLKFQSAEELLKFLGQSFEEALHREPELNQCESDQMKNETAELPQGRF